MKKADFIACSVAFHLALLLLALLLPPPFRPPRPDGGLTYVELAMPSSRPALHRHGGGRAYAHAAGEGIMFSERLASRSTRAEAREAVQEAPDTGDATARPSPPPPRPSEAGPPEVRPHAGEPKPAPRAGAAQVTITGEPRDKGVKADRTAISFRYQRGWPAPGMVRLALDAVGGGVRWRARKDDGWLIVSPAAGTTPSPVSVGVDVSRLALGFYEGSVEIVPDAPGVKGERVDVTLMVVPKSAGRKELPHSSWDAYMNGDCKVCHLPEGVMPSKDFMLKPGFCALCHGENGMARAAGAGGHPVMAAAGAGGTRRPTRGTVATGPGSDRMDTHLPGGKVVCVTCHNVMEKPGEYGRAWELASSGDRRVYALSGGGWEGMGHITPRVYVTPSVMQMPGELKEARKYLAPPGSYTYDESEGTVTFKGARAKGDVVYVTLTNPYLRVTTESNALCFDCHSENTHEGMNCLDCHRMHGTRNRACIAPAVRLSGGNAKKVVFLAKNGENSFADGGGEGICEACHPLKAHKDGKTHAGEDCTVCHAHKDGFSS